MSRRSSIAMILAVAVTLGALREFLFVNLNYQLDHVLRATDQSFAHSMFQRWTDEWTGPALLRLKWGLGLVFTALMLGLTLLLARRLFGDHRYAPHIITGYVLVGALALALNFASTWAPPLEVLAVKLLHTLQYPVLLLVLWAASPLAWRRS